MMASKRHCCIVSAKRAPFGDDVRYCRERRPCIATRRWRRAPKPYGSRVRRAALPLAPAAAVGTLWQRQRRSLSLRAIVAGRSAERRIAMHRDTHTHAREFEHTNTHTSGAYTCTHACTHTHTHTHRLRHARAHTNDYTTTRSRRPVCEPSGAVCRHPSSAVVTSHVSPLSCTVRTKLRTSTDRVGPSRRKNCLFPQSFASTRE